MAVINERLDSIGIFLRPENQASMEELLKSLRTVKNIRVIMIKLRKGVIGGPVMGGGISQGLWATLRQVSLTIRG